MLSAWIPTRKFAAPLLTRTEILTVCLSISNLYLSFPISALHDPLKRWRDGTASPVQAMFRTRENMA